jgi:hypothetical protein
MCGDQKLHTYFGCESHEKKQLAIPRSKRAADIKIYVKELGCEDVNCRGFCDDP